MIKLFVRHFRGNPLSLIEDCQSAGASLILLDQHKVKKNKKSPSFSFEIYTDNENYLAVVDMVLFHCKSCMLKECREDWTEDDILYSTWCYKMRRISNR